jgi:predicted amidohydrolase
MRLGFLQMQPRFGEVDRNVDHIENALRRVRHATIVLPELVTTGYVFESRREAWDLAETRRGRSVQRLRDLARSRDLTLCFGFAERDGERVYNSAATVTPQGRVHVYRKAHLFDREKVTFDRAEKPVLRAIRGETRLGVMICFDWIFPETCRSLALSGARVILHPSNLVMPWCQQAMTTRTLENAVFAVTCNRVGTESRRGISLRFTGRSQVLDTKGRVLARAGVRGESLQIVNIDPEEAANKKINTRNHLLRDRRPDVYRTR